ncbi:MAG: DUF2325 domain-containing protein [Campylobacterota bacterium]|nr:DUF2325 domain-containing protein [Campylobacterota bacterium]
MSVLLIGGDKIERLKELLKHLGAKHTTHWDSRKNSTLNKKIPKNIDLIIMLTDFLQHNSMSYFKKTAKKKNIPYICTRRGSASVENSFSKFIEGGK